jgi:hypothetical protein
MSEPDIHLLLQGICRLRRFLAPRPFCCFCSEFAANANTIPRNLSAFVRHVPAISSKNSAVRHGKPPFTSAIGPDVENKQATFKRLFSNFSRRDPHPPASSLTMEGAVSLSGPSGVDAIGG